MRATVIRTFGDPVLASAIVSGMRIEPIHSDAARRVAMRQHTPEEWAEMIAKADYYYGTNKRHGVLYKIVLGLWARFWLGVYGWYDYFKSINRED